MRQVAEQTLVSSVDDTLHLTSLLLLGKTADVVIKTSFPLVFVTKPVIKLLLRLYKMALFKVNLHLLEDVVASKLNDAMDFDVFVKSWGMTRLREEWKPQDGCPVTAALVCSSNQRHDHRHDLTSSLLVSLKELPEDSKITHDKSQHSLHVFVSRKFVHHFKVDPESSFSLHPVFQTFQLKNIIVGTTLPLKEAQAKFNEVQQNAVILREGNVAFGQQNLLVLESLPVHQGIFSSTSTEVTFVRVSDLKKSTKRFFRDREMSINLNSRVNRSVAKLNIQLRHHDHIEYKGEVFDPEATIIVSNEILHRMRATEGSWFKCKVIFNTTIFEWRLCQVMSSKDVPDDVTLMSKQLLFNMTGQKPIMLSSTPISLTLDVDVTSETPKILQNLNHLDFVDCLTVALIPSPSYSGSTDFSSLLSHYFSRPRFLLKHDVFVIETTIDELPSVSPEDDNESRVLRVSFKVTRIEGTGFWVEKDKSTLIQVGFTNSYVPSQYSFLTNGQHDCDSDMFLNLSTTLRPYMQSLLTGPVKIAVSGAVGSGKEFLIKTLAENSCQHLLSLDVNLMLLDTPAATETKIRISLEKALVYQPCIVHLKNFDLFLQENKSNDERYSQLIKTVINSIPTESKNQVIITATLEDEKSFVRNASFYNVFDHHLRVKEPDEKERIRLLKVFSKDLSISSSIDFSTLSKKTNSFSVSDLRLLMSRSVCHAYQRLSKELNVQESNDIIIAEVTVTQNDIDFCLNEMVRRNKKSQGAPEIPFVRWEDIGGLEDVKKEITETIQLPLNFPGLFSSGLKRGGLLLHGPPGTGKTLIAKAVATECCINFYSVKGPELINMYVGQSEENVRNVFSRARTSIPCVIFFDELDSLAPNRGKSGDSGGVMDRVVSQLLAEMDGLSQSKGLFVIGATNRLDLLDPALLRPGRFDKIIHVPVPSDSQSRLKILEALTRKLTLGSDVLLSDIQDRCPPSFSGADFYSLVSSAMNQSLSRSITLIQEGVLREEDAQILLTRDDFSLALQNFAPPESSASLS